MEEVKNKLSSGEFKTIQNEGKSTVWRYFRLVVNADFNVAVGYVQCRKCKVVMKYDSKRTGNSALQRHVDIVCKTTDDAGWLLQPSIAAFASCSRKIPLQDKQKITEKCLAFCCKDIRPFRSNKGRLFMKNIRKCVNSSNCVGVCSWGMDLACVGVC